MPPGRRTRLSAGSRPWWVAVPLLCLLPALLAAGARAALDGSLVWTEVALAYLFALALAFLGGLTTPAPDQDGGRWTLVTPLSAVVGLALMLLPAGSANTALSWLGLGAFWVALLHIWLSYPARRGRQWLASVALALALAAIAAFVPVAILQWHERFSGEEAFAIAQAGLLGLVFILIIPPAYLVARRTAPPRLGPRFALRTRWLAPLLVLLFAAVGARTLVLYQASFFDPSPPAYTGVSEESPFLCLPAPAPDQVYDGKEVFARLIGRLAANPNKRAPEYGMLAIATGKTEWAEQFKSTLLQEAGAGAFTGPSDSVKYTQYEASLRAYYLPLVRQAFPALFNEDETRRLAGWFEAINRRALTVEWSDWVYAAALGIRPTGLYENQENGAGLVANLITSGLEDPSLAEANRKYLLNNVRGWMTNFRNTDDTVVYQPEWINNALFQSLSGQPVDDGRKALAFEWLLVQALPSGQTPPYNYPSQPSLAGIAYLAAIEQHDPRYIWLAGRALDYAEASGKFVAAQPGVSAPVDLRGTPPEMGSCLLYGDSGLPNRAGPLAPDKIVLRSGWDANAAYVLLNLRFTGWHRYKATNSTPVVSFGKPVVRDQPARASFSWLPTGRSLFRDKRIRREDLNGLLIPARGLAPAISALTGIGTKWAQDPPWHAEVRQFGQRGAWDVAQTAIRDWNDWSHVRSTYLHHDGQIVVVVDSATGPREDGPALTWHLDGGPWAADPSAASALRTGSGAAARKIVGLGADAAAASSWELSGSPRDGQSWTYTSPTAGALETVTVFLAGPAADADVRIDQQGQERRLVVGWGGQVEELPLVNPTP